MGNYKPHKPCVKAVVASNQSIPNATWTELDWDSAISNTGDGTGTPDFFSSFPSTDMMGYLTIAPKGWWRLTARGKWSNNSTGLRKIIIEMNITTTIAEANVAGSGTTANYTSGIVDKQADLDYFSVKVWQNSGAALNFQATNSAFEAEYIGPT